MSQAVKSQDFFLNTPLKEALATILTIFFLYVLEIGK
jgi:hypothetical protein